VGCFVGVLHLPSLSDVSDFDSGIFCAHHQCVLGVTTFVCVSLFRTHSADTCLLPVSKFFFERRVSEKELGGRKKKENAAIERD